jgi:hypothetical protein
MMAMKKPHIPKPKMVKPKGFHVKKPKVPGMKSPLAGLRMK